MTANRKFMLKAILYALSAVLLCALPNLLIDPQHIFRKNFDLPLVTDPNLRFKKMEFIINNKNKYDSFLFGASTTGFIDPFKIPASAGRFYNMYYSEGLPGEYLDDIRMLLKNGVKIKCIMIGLDNFSYKVDPKSHVSQWMRHPYKDSWLKRMFFLLRYTLSPISAQRMAYLKALIGNPENGAVYDIGGKGNVTWPKSDHAKPDFNKLSGYVYPDVDRVGKTLEELKEIISIANTNNIKTVIFINPIYRVSYLNFINHDYFFEFKKGLAQMTDYYDFSGMNPVARDDRYFYEMAHYRPNVGGMIISKIFNINSGDIPPGFGVFVTRDNIDEHIADQKKGITDEKEQGSRDPRPSK